MTQTALRDRTARDALVEGHLDLVRHVVARLPIATDAVLDRDDLHSAGVLGLLRAAESWDPHGGASFVTFAFTVIRGSVLDEVRRHDPVPRHRRRRLRQLERATVELRAALDRAPTLEELAEHLGATAEQLDADLAALHVARTLSLDAPWRDDCGADGEAGPDAGLAVAREAAPVDDAAHAELCERLATAIARLPERERHVVVLYHREDLYLREIGRLLGVTESRVCQLLARATTRLRLALRDADEGG
ncbi:MAG: FliA/WhiG family RNA polymerase sigma factor [Planctomycetes bacterium]|nr:FliA/WhiG family RNA polymerase sigma factor [Planctomycetota bacterium]